MHANKVFFIYIYNNQVNKRALIGQSAMVYCAGKLIEKIARLLNYYLTNKEASTVLCSVV